jgi:hypothetical protein
MLLVGAACLGMLAIGLVVTPLQAHADNDSATLVAHWAFDEATAGSPAVDSVGGNNGTPIQGIPTDLPPTEDWPVATYPEPSIEVPAVPFHDPFSASFNGGNYFAIDNPVSLDFTICAWVKTTSVGGAHHWTSSPILEAEAGGADFDFGFGVDDNGKLMFGNGGTFDAGPVDAQVNGATTINDNAWHHLCATRSDSDGGTVGLYVDAKLDAAGVTGTGALTKNPFARIGSGTDGAQPFAGLIDDLRVYGTALSAEQVATVHAGGDPFAEPTGTAGPTSTSTSTPTATATAAPGTSAAGTPSRQEPPADDDGIAAAVEAAAPNDGDANGDGIPDAEQSTVASFPHIHTGRYVSLVVDDGCRLTSAAGANRSAEAGDEGFTYPAGLIEYTAKCATGAEVLVEAYFYGAPDTDLVARKFDPATGRYTYISGAVLTRMTIGGAPVVKVSYQVADGGPLDSDGVVNGIIVDPVGLAQADAAPDAVATTPAPQSSAAPALADTGFGGTARASLAGSAAILAGLLLLLAVRRRRDEAAHGPSAR